MKIGRDKGENEKIQRKSGRRVELQDNGYS